MTTTTTRAVSAPQAELFGHPTGLFTLFFAEMWERFSYYGMRALLVLYMIKGFLSYNDRDAYAVYAAYGGLVYLTPFFGGMIADKLLGARRAVILGGLLMAAGHLLMTIEHQGAFFGALALLICGNGFFKPNISTIVGTLYPEGSAKRDGGFTIFYMGINLGAAMSPLICGYVGETYGWHYGFGLATIGMLVGLAVFVAPTIMTQGLILVGALATATSMYLLTENVYLLAINLVVAAALVVAAVVAVAALGRGGLPAEAGQPVDRATLSHAKWVYLGTLVALPVMALLVHWNISVKLISDELVQSITEGGTRLSNIAGVFLTEISTPAGLMIVLTLAFAFVYLLLTAIRSPVRERHRMYVVLVLTFFSMLFWAFFEQAGSSVSNFTDRNVDRVFAERSLTAADVGTTVEVELTQEQLGYTLGERVITLDVLDAARERARAQASEEGGQAPGGASEAGSGAAPASDGADPADDVLPLVVRWPVSEDDVGMAVASRDDEIPASTFQAVNPLYIILFGLVFTALWALLAKLRLEPSTPVKFALGLIQLGLGFGCFWYGAQGADERGMVWLGWLMFGYLFQTTGELCLSPVGLSMVTKLSPARLVSTVMGAWFLATAASNFIAGVIAQFTGVGHGGDGGDGIPVPADTVNVYGDVFQVIAISALACGGICLLLAPLLTYWMHEKDGTPPGAAPVSASEGSAG